MITTILIDIDDTLLDFDLCASDSIKRGFVEWGIPYKKAVFGAFKRINNALWRKIEIGQLTREELLRIRWQTIFDELGINADGAEFENTFIKYLIESHSEVPGALDALKYLSRKYTLCAASNAPHEQQLKRLEKAGMLEYISQVFTSESTGYTKPSEKFFDVCFSQLNNPEKSEVLLIGNSITADIKGGIDYGIKTCWLNRNGNRVGAKRNIDYVITSFSEIKNIL